MTMCGDAAWAASAVVRRRKRRGKSEGMAFGKWALCVEDEREREREGERERGKERERERERVSERVSE